MAAPEIGQTTPLTLPQLRTATPVCLVNQRAAHFFSGRPLCYPPLINSHCQSYRTNPTITTVAPLLHRLYRPHRNSGASLLDILLLGTLKGCHSEREARRISLSQGQITIWLRDSLRLRSGQASLPSVAQNDMSGSEQWCNSGDCGTGGTDNLTQFPRVIR